MSEKIRVLRVIEFTGPRDKVEDQVARSLHGEKRLPNGVTIRAATVGAYPEMLEDLSVICPYCKHPDHGDEVCQHVDVGRFASNVCACTGKSSGRDPGYYGTFPSS